jgi:FMN phosphatase YigB (HAD superfamily)
LVNGIFNPKLFAKRCAISQEMVTFIKTCKKEGYRVCILSNWDADSFKRLRKKYADFFELFACEDIFISSQLGMAKPDFAIYEYVRKKVNGFCVFIDDQYENLEMAQQCGIHTIHFAGDAIRAFNELVNLIAATEMEHSLLINSFLIRFMSDPAKGYEWFC